MQDSPIILYFLDKKMPTSILKNEWEAREQAKKENHSQDNDVINSKCRCARYKKFSKKVETTLDYPNEEED